MTAQDRTRLWVVRSGVVIGVMGLSITAMYARGLGPAGRATGGATGCNAGEDIEAARDLVENPDPVEMERKVDPDVLLKRGPTLAVDGQLIVALTDVVSPADDPELMTAFGELGIVDPVPFADRIPVQDAAAKRPFEGIFVVKTPNEVHAAIERLADLAIVDWVEPVTEIGPMAELKAYAGRPLQWNLDVVGQPWIEENTNQGKGVTIAVIDSGYLPGGMADPEFQRPGWDFVDNDAEPLDGMGHGTLVVNTIGHQADNGQFAGIAPQATLMTERVLDDRGFGTTLDLAAAVIHATLADADVILMPLGGNNPSLLVGEALDFADARGSILIAASGNDGMERLAFPASHPAVISVGAVNPLLETAPYTNGAKVVDVLAPGGDLTTDGDGDDVADGIIAEQDGRWIAAEGTSLAAAHVAAVAAVAVADGRIEPHLLRRQLRTQGADRVVDAQRVVEGARSMRGGAILDADPVLVATRMPNAPFRVQLAFESMRPAQTTCEWDGGQASREVFTAMQRVILNLRPDMDTRVVCRTTDDAGQIEEQEILIRPPFLAASQQDDSCAPLDGDTVDAFEVDGKVTGSVGAICTTAPE